MEQDVTMQIADPGPLVCAPEKNVVLRNFSVEMGLHKLRMTQWCPEDLDALFIKREI